MATAKRKIGLGVDPEFFTIDTKSQRYCSAHKLVPGTKEKPYPLNKGAVQVDGVALEFNTDPAYSGKEFAENVKTVLAQIREMVPERYEFSFKPAVFFDRYYFDNHVPEHPKELGCMPDHNGWTGEINPRPVPPVGKETMRTASGHMHISWTEGADIDDPSHRYDCNLVCRALEKTVGPWLKYIDRDKNRADLYGKPGALRYKSYGLEWRVPSNEWLNHPEIWEWIYDIVYFTVDGLFTGKIEPDKKPSTQEYGGRFAVNYYNARTSKAPAMPTIKRETEPYDLSCKRVSTKKYKLKRISPTASTTKWDINLDIPAKNQSNMPIPAYLAAQMNDIHPNKGYSSVVGEDDYDYGDD